MLLLDDDFVMSYKDGLVCEFVDGVFRHAFFRFVTHSSDYPEKYVLTVSQFPKVDVVHLYVGYSLSAFVFWGSACVLAV
jgi:hypothetical protein